MPTTLPPRARAYISARSATSAIGDRRARLVRHAGLGRALERAVGHAERAQRLAGALEAAQDAQPALGLALPRAGERDGRLGQLECNDHFARKVHAFFVGR